MLSRGQPLAGRYAGGFPGFAGLESGVVIQRRKAVCWVLGLWVVPIPVGPALGEGEAASVPAVRLERLYQLPQQLAPRATQAWPGGADREEWEQRFRLAHRELDEATAAIGAAQKELEGMASGGGSWQLAAPGAGAGAENSPLSFRLRQELRRQRENQAKARAKLTDLRVEASLAGVPQEWQDAQSASNQDRLGRKKQNAGSAKSAVDAK